ncbi:hypothetical protein BDV29DRAFT_158686 [Aspergillus leporis]|uniref:Uncharacterized protein n=1 Tax=Aspergillus leporis TaxID=41062 RepID=A0A5N5WYH1_9EURO|nr:hypothetical protein BDV29DRAFT_158686 [Aspergillus leporis]
MDVSHGAFYDSGHHSDLIKRYQTTNGRSATRLNESLSGLRGRTIHLAVRKNRRGELIIKPKIIHSLARPGDGTDFPRERQPQIKCPGASSKEVKFWVETSQTLSTSQGVKKKDRKPGPPAPPSGPGRWITVYEYFLQTYSIRDGHPDLPVVNIGSRMRPTYVLA